MLCVSAASEFAASPLACNRRAPQKDSKQTHSGARKTVQIGEQINVT